MSDFNFEQLPKPVLELELGRVEQNLVELEAKKMAIIAALGIVTVEESNHA